MQRLKAMRQRENLPGWIGFCLNLLWSLVVCQTFLVVLSLLPLGSCELQCIWSWIFLDESECEDYSGGDWVLSMRI